MEFAATQAKSTYAYGTLRERGLMKNQEFETQMGFACVDAVSNRPFKGFPRNKLPNLVGRARSPSHIPGGLEAHHTRKFRIFYYLEVPNVTDEKSRV
ncbi:hypothetical protein Cylst_2868 [Cylindrospermum stagnale PCC 7417]|uniref:Uncharacterized protein n=1 Tax=Cylindrospermum stagnale PCC 7417 TaxID=56107 RepID=K9WZ42_9NOST|nr:hypothetical protein [Cylindrospermum stagnale]AFZ25061.1 hypothetical protein Cylst_2868 [Cylindrospermum stagnale PCC 7417]